MKEFVMVKVVPRSLLAMVVWSGRSLVVGRAEVPLSRSSG